MFRFNQSKCLGDELRSERNLVALYASHANTNTEVRPGRTHPHEVRDACHVPQLRTRPSLKFLRCVRNAQSVAQRGVQGGASSACKMDCAARHRRSRLPKGTRLRTCGWEVVLARANADIDICPTLLYSTNKGLIRMGTGTLRRPHRRDTTSRLATAGPTRVVCELFHMLLAASSSPAQGRAQNVRGEGTQRAVTCLCTLGRASSQPRFKQLPKRLRPAPFYKFVPRCHKMWLHADNAMCVYSGGGS